MIDVLDPDGLTGFRRGPFRYSAQDGRYYLLSDDGAIPADGPRMLTALDEGQLSRVGSDHFTFRDGAIDAEPPASPAPVGEYALEGQMFGLHFPGAIGLAGPTGVTRLHRRLNLDFLAGEALDPRLTFTRASAATRVNASGLIELVGNNMPRFDYDPVTHAPRGLLLEPAATNLVLRSSEFDSVAWTKSRTSTIANAATAPDGTLTADKIVEDTSASATHRIYQGVAKSGGSLTRTLSVFLKAAERTKASLRFAAQSELGVAHSVVDLTAGTIGPVTIAGPSYITDATAKITSLGAGWYRCTLTATFTNEVTATLALISIANDAGETAYTGNGTSGLYAWGAQIADGPVATSYIPTSGVAATRAADSPAMTGKSFSDWYNPAEGTFVVEADCTDIAAGGGTLLSVDAGGGLNRLQIYKGGGSPTCAVYGGSNLAIVGQIASNTVSRAGLRYSAATSTVSGSLNGGAVASTALPAMAPFIQLRSIDWNGHLRRIRYIPRAVSDAELQALTA